MHSNKHKAPSIFHMRFWCNILYENILRMSLDHFLPFTFYVIPAIFFQAFPLVSCCIVLNTLLADHKVISCSSSFSARVLSVYFFILPPSLLLLSNSFHRPYHSFITSFFWQMLLCICLKYSPNSSLWQQHAVMHGSSKPFLPHRMKWFSTALCCSLQRSFVLWLLSQ